MGSSTLFLLIPKSTGKAGLNADSSRQNLKFYRAASTLNCFIRRDAIPHSLRNSARRTAKFACSTSAVFHERRTWIFWLALIAVCAKKPCLFNFLSSVMARIPHHSRNRRPCRFSPLLHGAPLYPPPIPRPL